MGKLTLLVAIITFFVNRSWKLLLENSRFWLRKCRQKHLSEIHRKDWNKLIQKLECTSLEPKLTLCLMRLHFKLPSEQSPLHVAARSGDLDLVQIIIDENIGYVFK